MFFSKLLLNGRYFKNGVGCSVGWRLKATETQSCASGDSKPSSDPSISRVGNGKWSLIVRVFRDSKGNLELAPFGQKVDKATDGQLTKALQKLNPELKLGDTIVVPGVSAKDYNYVAVALTVCGPKDLGINDVEALNEKKENVRCCFAAGYKALKGITCDLYDIEHQIDDLDAQQAAHEGYRLAQWTPTNEFTSPPPPLLSKKYGGWAEGINFAEAQNWARHISQLPTNKMIPAGVVEEANHLTKLGVNVTSYDQKDIKDMAAFLAVAQGSITPPKLLVCEYKGDTTNASNVLLVAKGVTFDSGGLCLKTPAGLLERNGVTGAAAALGTMRGLALLKASVNVKLVLPLCENMISGNSLRVGDVVQTLNGLKVKVEDTDLEGHLMLADALTYGQKKYTPNHVISIASLTPGIAAATGSGCYGCFTKSDELWRVARDAGADAGDRPWRFPIWDFYRNQITGDTPLFDLKNRGSGIASHCIGAAFLDKFVTCKNWLHYDITGVGRMAAGEAPMYLDPNFMTGRPTRALIQAIMTINKKNDDDCPIK